MEIRKFSAKLLTKPTMKQSNMYTIDGGLQGFVYDVYRDICTQ